MPALLVASLPIVLLVPTNRSAVGSIDPPCRRPPRAPRRLWQQGAVVLVELLFLVLRCKLPHHLPGALLLIGLLIGLRCVMRMREVQRVSTWPTKLTDLHDVLDRLELVLGYFPLL